MRCVSDNFESEKTLTNRQPRLLIRCLLLTSLPPATRNRLLSNQDWFCAKANLLVNQKQKKDLGRYCVPRPLILSNMTIYFLYVSFGVRRVRPVCLLYCGAKRIDDHRNPSKMNSSRNRSLACCHCRNRHRDFGCRHYD